MCKKGERCSQHGGSPSPSSLVSLTEFYYLDNLPLPALQTVLLNMERTELNTICRTNRRAKSICVTRNFQIMYEEKHKTKQKSMFDDAVLIKVDENEYIFAWTKVREKTLKCIIKATIERKKGIAKIKNVFVWEITEDTMNGVLVLSYEACNPDMNEPWFVSNDKSFLRKIGKKNWAKMIRTLDRGKDFDVAYVLQREFLEEANTLLQKSKAKRLNKLPENLQRGYGAIRLKSVNQ